jgi:hypothetical protein
MGKQNMEAVRYRKRTFQLKRLLKAWSSILTFLQISKLLEWLKFWLCDEAKLSNIGNPVLGKAVLIEAVPRNGVVHAMIMLRTAQTFLPSRATNCRLMLTISTRLTAKIFP